MAEHPKQWHKFLHWAKYCYDTSFHSSFGMTPFKAVYGRDPPIILDYVPITTTTETVDNF